MKTKYTRIFSNPIRIKVAGLLMMLAVPFANAAYGDDQDAQLRGGLAHCRAKFLRERTGLVVYLGGSITNSPGWTQQVSADLTKRFPETKFTFVNAGIPSIDSTGHAFRFTRDVLQKGLPDLIIVEAAVNDLHNGRTAIESIRGLEGIVRQARRAQRNVDILGLHFADPAHLADYAAGRTPAVIASHEKVLAHYSIPSINFARDIQRQIAAGQLDWARDFKDVHPSPFGHDYYYRGIASLFDRAWPDPEKAAAPPKAPVEHASVAALDAHSYDAGTLVTPTRATDLQGFRMESNWKPTDKAGTRDGFVNVDMLAGTKPGDQFRFAFEGRAIGFFMTTGPDAGTIEYRIDGGEWKQRDTRTQWSNALHLPWLLVLESELESAPHQIEVRLVEPRANPNHSALRLRDIAVNGPLIDVPSLTEVQIKSSLDGSMQPSLYWAPEQAKTLDTPVLVYLHSWSGDYKQNNAPWQREAVKRDWIYLHPNFRGVNNHPAACGSKLARQDILDALDYIQSHYRVDRDRIYLAGSSGGGHMALLMASYFPERFSAVSAWVGITDLGEWYRFHAKEGKLDHYAQMTIDSLGGPPGAARGEPASDAKVDAAYRERSPIFHLERVGDLPLDIAAGVTDGHTGSVPIAHSLEAFNIVARVHNATLVSNDEMKQLSIQKKLTSPTSDDQVTDESYGRAILLRRKAGASRVTIFDGGHEGLPGAGASWLANQKRATQSPAASR